MPSSLLIDLQAGMRCRVTDDRHRIALDREDRDSVGVEAVRRSLLRATSYSGPAARSTPGPLEMWFAAASKEVELRLFDW